MDKIAKVRKEIERRKGYISVTHFAEELLSFLDTLEEEPDKSLEEELMDWCGKFNPLIREEIRSTAYHFANWQAEQDNYDVIFWKGMQHAIEGMKEEAVEGEIQMRYSGCLCAKTIRAINEDKFKLGDKVRIVVLPKED